MSLDITHGAAARLRAGAARRARMARRPEFWAPLFRPAPPVRVTPAGVAVTAGAVALGTALSLVRTTGPGAWNTTLMEDAAIFLSDDLRLGPLTALTQSYSGYFHVVPRLLATVAMALPADYAPVVFATEAALVTSLLAVFVYFASSGVLPHRLQRLLVSAPMVVLPLGQAEMPNAIAMLRWQLIYAVFWALLWRPASRTGQIIATGVVFAAAFSDNVVWLFIPLAALRLWQDRRSVQSTAMLGVLSVGFVADLVVVITGASERGVEPRLNPLWALSSFALRPVPQILLGTRWVSEGPAQHVGRLLLVALAWAIVGGILYLAWRRVTRPDWLLAGVATLFALAVYLFSTMIVGVAGPRYGAPPAMLMLTAFAALLSPSPSPAPAPAPRLVRWIGAGQRPLALLAGLLLVVCAVNLRLDGERTAGPRWDDELAAARAACAGGAPTAALRVSPLHYGWRAVLPCDYLTAHSEASAGLAGARVKTAVVRSR